MTMNTSNFKRMKKELSSQIDPHEMVDLSLDETLYFIFEIKIKIRIKSVPCSLKLFKVISLLA